MPHAAVADVEATHTRNRRKINGRNKSSSRGLVQQLDSYHTLFGQSQLSTSISRLLKNSKIPITRIVSLGLGSLTSPASQSRRLKQLSIFLAIAETLQRNSEGSVELFAQDPAFSRVDEALLGSLGVMILHTPSGSHIGEAGALIDENTLVYCPFLTVDAYELLLGGSSSVRYLIGDDFNVLVNKWPKHSPERQQVELVMKTAMAQYRRRVINGDGFWTEEDKSFPMACYQIQDERRKEWRAKL